MSSLLFKMEITPVCVRRVDCAGTVTDTPAYYLGFIHGIADRIEGTSERNLFTGATRREVLDAMLETAKRLSLLSST